MTGIRKPFYHVSKKLKKVPQKLPKALILLGFHSVYVERRAGENRKSSTTLHNVLDTTIRHNVVRRNVEMKHDIQIHCATAGCCSNATVS